MSTPLCSFLVYLDQDRAHWESFLQDFQSFFKKFPVPHELIVLVEKGSDCTPLFHNHDSQDSLIVRVNTKKLSRTASLRQGCEVARGEILIFLQPHLPTPLADVFKVLQYFISDPQLEMCWGERYSKKQSAFHTLATPRFRNEHLFNKILSERFQPVGLDPLCEMGGLRKSTWNKIKETLSPQRGWYWGLDLLNAAQKMNIKVTQIYVQDSGLSSTSYSIWKERWNLLKKSIF